jgi:hypothetical protein
LYPENDRPAPATTVTIASMISTVPVFTREALECVTAESSYSACGSSGTSSPQPPNAERRFNAVACRFSDFFLNPPRSVENPYGPVSCVRGFVGGVSGTVILVVRIVHVIHVIHVARSTWPRLARTELGWSMETSRRNAPHRLRKWQKKVGGFVVSG